jgi:hypothetical protein
VSNFVPFLLVNNCLERSCYFTEANITCIPVKPMFSDVIMSQKLLNIDFRRALMDNIANRWIHLCTRWMDVQLTQQPDVFKWGISISRLFSVKSMYIGYMDDPTKYLQKYVWRIKVPLKIGVFMWFLRKKVLLTKDN